MVARTAAIDAEVLATLAEDVLRPTVIDRAIALALEELAPAGAGRARRQLEAELTKVTDECGRLAEAIGRGGRLTSLLVRLRVRNPRQSASFTWRRRSSAVRSIIGAGSPYSASSARRASARAFRRVSRRDSPDVGVLTFRGFSDLRAA
jgi:hypothetical protein